MSFMKKSGTFTVDSEELRKLINDHPDYPIAFLVNEDAISGEYNSEYNNNVYVGVQEILDANMPDSDYVCDDRDDFEYRIENWLVDKMDEEKPNWSEEEFEEEFKKEKEKYDAYWKNMIVVSIG